MPERNVRKSEQLNKDLFKVIEEKMKGKDITENLMDQLLRKGLKFMVTKFLEEEVTEFLGRDYYERSDDSRGYRNGYESSRIRLSSGDRVSIPKPRVRDTEEKYESKLWKALKEGSKQFERVVTEMYARGLSTRDIEAILTDPDTGELYLSRSSVSKITESLNAEYEEFKNQDLSQYDVVYLFLDGVYESVRRDYGLKEGILCAWAICSDGRKILLNIDLGNRESTEAWTFFLHEMISRGLNTPVLVITDGAPGLIKAVKNVFPNSLRQRCLAHKKRNVLNKVPDKYVDEVRREINAVLEAPSQKTARLLLKLVEEKYGSRFPSAIKCLKTDFEACITYMQFPPRHHKYIRTTNSLERCFEEQKRRTKVIPGFFDEKSALKLIFAALIRGCRNWKGVTFNKQDKAILDNIRKELGIKNYKCQRTENKQLISC